MTRLAAGIVGLLGGATTEWNSGRERRAGSRKPLDQNRKRMSIVIRVHSEPVRRRPIFVQSLGATSKRVNVPSGREVHLANPLQNLRGEAGDLLRGRACGFERLTELRLAQLRRH